MAFPDDAGVCGESEEALDRLTRGWDVSEQTYGVWRDREIGVDVPNLDITPTIDPRPDTQHILAASYTQHSTADLLTSLSELVAHNCQKQILPVSVRDTFLQPDDPFASSLIFVVLPYWPDALLEDVIVGD